MWGFDQDIFSNDESFHCKSIHFLVIFLPILLVNSPAVFLQSSFAFWTCVSKAGHLVFLV